MQAFLWHSESSVGRTITSICEELWSYNKLLPAKWRRIWPRHYKTITKQTKPCSGLTAIELPL